MQIWHSSSSESKPCVMCGKMTAHYKVYEQSSMALRIPLCDNSDGSTCYSMVDIKGMTSRFLIDAKKAIKAQATTNTV